MISSAEPMAVEKIYAPLGSDFTPSMLTARYTPQRGWNDLTIGPHRPLQIDPGTAALHYGQAAFEGVRVCRQAGGGYAMFRPLDYAQRLAVSCQRIAIPPIDAETMVEWLRAFCEAELPHLSDDPDASIYLRPLVMATDAVLGARPSETFMLLLLALRAVPLEESGRHQLAVMVTSEYTHSSPGGLGSAKTPGMYGSSMRAMADAMACGCDQVLWLDNGRHRWVEQMGAMNVAFVLDGTVVTPPPSESIIDGVTRDSLLKLCLEHRVPFEERPVTIEEVTSALSWLGLTEAFGCSTSTGITPIGSLLVNGQRIALPRETPVTDRLRSLLADISHGRVPDNWGWLLPV